MFVALNKMEEFIVINEVNPYKPHILFVGHRQNSADPDQTPLNAASDQGLQLSTVCLQNVLFKFE